MKFDGYRTLIFDCDGVILDSNKIKTRAFYEAALPYGESAANALVDFHVRNGGISRYKKFEYFLSQILGQKEILQKSLDNLLQRFSDAVFAGLLSCDIAPGLNELRRAMPHVRWLIVSGGDQGELRKVFLQRGLISIFDGGIYGSPSNKDEILKRERCNRNIAMPAIFMGDSEYDYEVSKKHGLDFLFVSGWTEFKGWQDFCAQRNIQFVQNVSEMSNRKS